MPGFQALDYDISNDGKQIVMEAEDPQGKPHLWLASFEDQLPPRQISNVEGRTPRFGPTGEIFFRSSGSVYRVDQDGTAIRKALEQAILAMKMSRRTDNGFARAGWPAGPRFKPSHPQGTGPQSLSLAMGTRCGRPADTPFPCQGD